MDKKIKNAFQKDIDSCSLMSNNLKFDQIKNRIEIEEDILENGNIHQKDNYFKTHWKLISSFAAIIVVFSISLLYFSLNNNVKYKESPFSEQLDGTVFGKKTKDFIQQNRTISDYIDLQDDEKNPVYFYEVDMKKIDNYYTCGYFPTSNYEDVISLAQNKAAIYDYTDDLEVIDGKLLVAYMELFDEDVKWYQVSKDSKEIPNKIKGYTLGLVLGSRDIYFSENKTTGEMLNFTRKIFVREFYDLNTKMIDNTFNLDSRYIHNCKEKNLFVLKDIVSIYSESIMDISFIEYYHIKSNDALLPITDKTGIDLIGEYKNQLEEIKISEYTENDILYGKYDYQEFCKMFFK